MIVLEIPDRDLKIEVPTEWHELNTEQCDFVLKKIFDCQCGFKTKDETLISILFYLLDVEIDYLSVARRKLRPNKMQVENDADLLILAETLFSQWFDGNQIKFDSVYNPYPTLMGVKGPETLLADISFKQFKEALRHSQDFYENKETQHLDKLVMTLYPMFPVIYNVKEIPEYKKIAVLLFFTNCIQFLQTEDVLIDGNLLNFSVLFPKRNPNAKPEKNDTGWMGLLYDIAEKGVFGDMNKVEQIQLYQLFTYLLNNYNKRKNEKV